MAVVGRHAHQAQPPGVRAQRRPHAGVQPVCDRRGRGRRPEPGRATRVDGVRQAGGEVVLDLVVEAADEPAEDVAEHRHRRGHVGGRRSWWAAKSSPRRGAVVVEHRRHVDAVGELERDGEQEADQPRAREVEASTAHHGLNSSGIDDGPAEVGELAGGDLGDDRRPAAAAEWPAGRGGPVISATRSLTSRFLRARNPYSGHM